MPLGDDGISDGDKGFSDRDAFFLRIDKSAHGFQKTPARIFDDKIGKARRTVVFGDGLAFAFTHKAVIDMQSEHAILSERFI